MGLAELRSGQRQRLFGQLHATGVVARPVGGDHAMVELIPSFGRRVGLARHRSRRRKDEQADDGKALEGCEHGDAPECCRKIRPGKELHANMIAARVERPPIEPMRKPGSAICDLAQSGRRDDLKRLVGWAPAEAGNLHISNRFLESCSKPSLRPQDGSLS